MKNIGMMKSKWSTLLNKAEGSIFSFYTQSLERESSLQGVWLFKGGLFKKWGGRALLIFAKDGGCNTILFRKYFRNHIFFQLNVFYESQGEKLFNSSDRFLNAKEIKSLGKKTSHKEIWGCFNWSSTWKGRESLPTLEAIRDGEENTAQENSEASTRTWRVKGKNAEQKPSSSLQKMVWALDSSEFPWQQSSWPLAEKSPAFGCGFQPFWLRIIKCFLI